MEIKQFFPSRSPILLSGFLVLACSALDPAETDLTKGNQDEPVDPRITRYYEAHAHQRKSKSLGAVNNGSLIDGHLFPFKGNNYRYFDELSYTSGRAFLNSEVLKTALKAYEELEGTNKNRKYVVMECSHEKGGKLWPHRTHQNGLSIDFMMPLVMNGMPYYELDLLGARHYGLGFDDQGRYEKNNAVQIDFETVAQHLLALLAAGKKHRVRIKKVIIKVELKDELYAGKYGKQLKNSGIYVVRGLTPLINNLHDDHYHVDFEFY